jgi:hypothetical protein
LKYLQGGKVQTDDILKEVIVDYNSEVLGSPLRALNLDQDRSFLERKLNVVLGRMNYIADWSFAIVDFSKTIAANSDRVTIVEYDIFKPVTCKAIISGAEKNLTYYSFSDFEIRASDYYGTTNNDPSDYSIAGEYVYIGPGKAGSATTIFGQVRRKLTINDTQYLPEQMLIDGLLMRLFKKGTGAQIAAWNGWNNGIKDVSSDAKKRTAEDKTLRQLDPIVLRNQRYLNSL